MIFSYQGTSLRSREKDFDLMFNDLDNNLTY